MSALFVVEASFAIASLEHPEPSDATLTAAPMFMINSLLFILVSLSWLYFSLLRQPPAEPGGERLGVEDRSVADSFLYLFRREHDRIDVFVRVLVLRMRRF